jgi:class 3 adenylate cyclase/tetratricopeptide (TPR) repeat protein
MAVSRKTVTVLFADVADSTGLGERLDPESVRSALGRWFEAAQEVIEHHGGTVEKFIGDAVMAVFGIPQLHEDDAVRAVRAAEELRAAFDRLNQELERERGLRLAIRVGVNTGEVVTGDGGGTLVTGDAVNVAKRLEEAARSGEILVGSATERLARATATFELLEPLDLRGKSAPVETWRMVAVEATARPFERRFDIPLVGRRDDLARLRAAYERAVADRTCHRFTLLGAAGVGKSRLTRELCNEIEATATFASGRCLPYGKGITFWPLQEAIRELGGEDGIKHRLARDDDADLVSSRLTGTGGSEEMFWAVRRLCESLSRERPLVLCFEDVHWAEPLFLDLIEYLFGWIRDAAVLIICLARPEFVEERPAWIADEERSASLTLKPLSAEETSQLLDTLGVTGVEREQITEAAEGHPLYIEQMAAMVEEGGYADGLFTVPPTIQALLAARLDRLTAMERGVIERAAVCGKEFWRGEVVELTPEEDREFVGATLMSLVRKDLIRPRRSAGRPDDAFRFGHVLIRDATYVAIPKQTRAYLHERFGDWIQANLGEFGLELDEIIGYHLEQAYSYRVELAPVDDDARRLAGRAGDLLGNAGRRAAARGDAHAAANLLTRALRLAGDDGPSRFELMLALGSALRSAGHLAEAQGMFTEARRLAEALDDRNGIARASVESAFVQLYTWDGRLDDLLPVSWQAAAVFESTGDDDGLSRALMLHAYVSFIRCRWAETEETVDRALRHARRVAGGRQEQELLHIRARAALRGPAPVETAIERCEAVLEQNAGDRSLEAVVRGGLGLLEAMRGRLDTARAQVDEAERLVLDLGSTLALAAVRGDAGAVHLLSGDAAAASRALRAACDTLESIGEQGLLSTFAALLADALVVLGDEEDAGRYMRLSEESALSEDVLSQVLWRIAGAQVMYREGALDASRGLADEAVTLAEETDDLNLTGDAFANLGSVLTAIGQSSEAAVAYRRAVVLYERKGNVVSAARARQRGRDPAARI